MKLYKDGQRLVSKNKKVVITKGGLLVRGKNKESWILDDTGVSVLDERPPKPRSRKGP